ncbi:hypothetical protein VP01_2020g7 [Puccinia sorghi]|uniref:Uncharacterized protein n=1 Tax=Puccinia sorghi TaxID=27349 RepID=A0A0L6VB22_9BASI|nr:hypothetical protein VP01_2020g7 [Puccinia sorghi]
MGQWQTSKGTDGRDWMVGSGKLMVTLRQMVLAGNRTSIRVLAQFFRILEGTIILYCSRVIKEILALESIDLVDLAIYQMR